MSWIAIVVGIEMELLLLNPLVACARASLSEKFWGGQQEARYV
jgi:hypothetical protein